MTDSSRLAVRSMLFLLLLVAGAAAVSLAVFPLAASSGGQPAGFSCKACDRKASEVERCRSIAPDAYTTGLLFNPPGMKTSYKRSSCLFGLARKYRDASLCEEVRERKSLFFDGSALTRENCEQNVREAMARRPPVVIADVKQLADVRWFRNGNGRDFDVHVGRPGPIRSSSVQRPQRVLVVCDVGVVIPVGIPQEADRLGVLGARLFDVPHLRERTRHVGEHRGACGVAGRQGLLADGQGLPVVEQRIVVAVLRIGQNAQRVQGVREIGMAGRKVHLFGGQYVLQRCPRFIHPAGAHQQVCLVCAHARHGERGMSVSAMSSSAVA